jgi:hypothetical protein
MKLLAQIRELDIPDEIPVDCGAGMGNINWPWSILLNIPKYLFLAGMILVFIAVRKKWSSKVRWAVIILTLFFGLVTLVLYLTLFGSLLLSWRDWVWMNVPKYGCL